MVQSLDKKHPAIRAEYQQGFANEKKVEAWLSSLGRNIVDSTLEEDIEKDIDCYVDGVSTSIKVNDPKFFNAAFLFELSYLRTGERKHRASWFWEGEAEQYIIWKRDTTNTGELWLLNKLDVVSHVMVNGWDKECQQHANVRQKQLLNGIEETKLGLLQKHKLIKLGIATLIVSNANAS